MKYLLVIAVVAFVVWLLTAKARGTRARPTGEEAAPSARKPQAMARCAHCGVHLPASDAVIEGASVYCSDAHRQLGPKSAR